MASPFRLSFLVKHGISWSKSICFRRSNMARSGVLCTFIIGPSPEILNGKPPPIPFKRKVAGSWLNGEDRQGRKENEETGDCRTLDDVVRAYIETVLTQTQWRIRGKGGAAELLGLKPTILESRTAWLGLKREV